MMTREKANEIFATELGQQLDVIYVTSDEKPFIRFGEAEYYAKKRHNENPLFDDTIEEWSREEEVGYTKQDIENFLFWGFHVSGVLIQYADRFNRRLKGANDIGDMLDRWRIWRNSITGDLL